MRLIDADALKKKNGLDIVTKYGIGIAIKRPESYSTMMRYEVEDMIDAAPTIEAEPVRHGYWEESPTGNPNFNYCSVCDGAIQRYDNVTFTYCPHCGAKMENGIEGRY